MNYKILRKLRIIFSALFFIPLTIIFADITNSIPAGAINAATYLQFMPSLLKFISIAGLTSAGFIIIILLTSLFGRVYCSSVCPLGVMQDLFNWLSKKITRRKKFLFSRPMTVTRLAFLLIPVLLILAGYIIPAALLDPYSNFGRIVAQLFKPVVVFVNNIISYLLALAGIFSVYTYDVKAFNPVPFILALAVFAFVGYMSFRRGRLFCNSVCPVGTLLGLVSRFSLFRIKIDEDNCKVCGACEKACKASCIETDTKQIDYSRCVMCLDCMQVCPTGGIEIKSGFTKLTTGSEAEDPGKRKFLGSAFFFIAASLPAAAQKQIQITKPSTKPIFRKFPASPPGSVSIERFNTYCTACNLCVSACPTQVLQPSFLEYGPAGIFQPWLDNSAGFCNFDCTICGDVCPTGAIAPIRLETKKLTQLGKAKFVKDNCIVFTQKTDCGACAEHCPTKAVHMIPEKNLMAPEVREEYCIGCGACEYACPTKPYKSIYVEGNPEHLAAKKNEEVTKPVEVNTKEEFPF